jgi:hypothetical protein
MNKQDNHIWLTIWSILAIIIIFAVFPNPTQHDKQKRQAIYKQLIHYRDLYEKRIERHKEKKNDY